MSARPGSSVTSFQPKLGSTQGAFDQSFIRNSPPPNPSTTRLGSQDIDRAHDLRSVHLYTRRGHRFKLAPAESVDCNANRLWCSSHRSNGVVIEKSGCRANGIRRHFCRSVRERYRWLHSSPRHPAHRPGYAHISLSHSWTALCEQKHAART